MHRPACLHKFIALHLYMSDTYWMCLNFRIHKYIRNKHLHILYIYSISLHICKITPYVRAHMDSHLLNQSIIMKTTYK